MGQGAPASTPGCPPPPPPCLAPANRGGGRTRSYVYAVAHSAFRRPGFQPTDSLYPSSLVRCIKLSECLGPNPGCEYHDAKLRGTMKGSRRSRGTRCLVHLDTRPVQPFVHLYCERRLTGASCTRARSTWSERYLSLWTCKTKKRARTSTSSRAKTPNATSMRKVVASFLFGESQM